MGVDGFRCDMAHMVPAEFWAWAIVRARARQPDVWFMAEAYDADPAKVPPASPLAASLGNVMFPLLDAGFNAVYDDPTYRTLKAIYDGPRWANDLDSAASAPFIYQNSLRYAENHDEIRLAARNHWAGIGPEVGRPVAAILFGIGRGPLMLYSGQEVGEPAEGATGFKGDDGRTTIFDYWSLPELIKWTNGHRYDGALLSDSQKNLRAYYARLLHLAAEPGFRFGAFRPLNPANRDTPHFGSVPGDPVSGHWLYAFLRYDPLSAQRWLVIANLHRTETFSNITLRIPPDTQAWLNLPAVVTLTDRLNDAVNETPPFTAPLDNLCLPPIPPLSAMYLQISPAK
jgi:glycosidase